MEIETKANNYLSKNKLHYIDMIEAIRRNDAKILYAENDGVLLIEKNSSVYMLSCENKNIAKKLLLLIPNNTIVVAHQNFTVPILQSHFHSNFVTPCFQCVYTKTDKTKINSDLDIQLLTLKELDKVAENYDILPKDEIAEIIKSGKLYGGYKNGKLIGFSGFHSEGSMGLLEIFPNYRHRGYGEALEKFVINIALDKNLIPYGHVIDDNYKSLNLQKKLGFEIADKKIYWLG